MPRRTKIGTCGVCRRTFDVPFLSSEDLCQPCVEKHFDGEANLAKMIDSGASRAGLILIAQWCNGGA